MGALHKLITGCETREEYKAFQERVDALRASLDDVPVGIFMAGTEFCVVLVLLGVNPEISAFDVPQIEAVEKRVAEYHASR